MTKILVVDDESDIELLIKQKFSKHIKSKELEFSFCSNGLEALKILHQNPDIHIIVTDINMPEMDGLTLLSHLPELKRLFKSIIISAYGDLSNIRKAMNRGASDFVTKPIDFKDLEITLSNVIEQFLTLKNAIEAQATLSELEKELTVARMIQQTIIPHLFKPIESDSYEILGSMIPAKQVGGDFFDFFSLDDHRFGFVIADVSGKGIPAAIFMSMSRAIIRTIAQHSTSPAECLKEANRILCIDNEVCMFVTVFYGIYDTRNGEIECCNAGHNLPFILESDGSLTEVGPYEGTPLGAMDQSVYSTHKLSLKKGDCLILYTDGVTEAMNKENVQYSKERLIDCLKSWKPGALSSLIDHILQDLHTFTSEAPASDDITMLCIRKTS